jgi:hypothetical protein
VTNQSSHSELSFHYNHHPLALLGLVPLYSSRYSERGHKIEKCSSLTYCHCCELCALKQKPAKLEDLNMSIKTLNLVRFSAYRTAMKLRKLQKTLALDSFKIDHMQRAFR